MATNHLLLTKAMQMVQKLMAPLRNPNPAISTWELARAPKYVVALRSTRGGSQPGRAFDLAEMRKNYKAARVRIYQAFEVPVLVLCQPRTTSLDRNPQACGERKGTGPTCGLFGLQFTGTGCHCILGDRREWTLCKHLAECNLWLRGPEFLQKPEHEWPT